MADPLILAPWLIGAGVGASMSGILTSFGDLTNQDPVNITVKNMKLHNNTTVTTYKWIPQKNLPCSGGLGLDPGEGA